jgi:transcriptional regulator with XRE-family HTH domain
VQEDSLQARQADAEAAPSRLLYFSIALAAVAMAFFVWLGFTAFL